MSITVTTDVFCDGDGCLAWTHGVVGVRAAPGDARRNAHAHGWIRRGGRDLCPACVNELDDNGASREH